MRPGIELPSKGTEAKTKTTETAENPEAESRSMDTDAREEEGPDQTSAE
jgi:hypothetical protein